MHWVAVVCFSLAAVNFVISQKKECFQKTTKDVDCKYKCNCHIQNCTGGCAGKTCYQQWHGTNCLKKNIAWNTWNLANTTFSKPGIAMGSSPQKAVDGSTALRLYDIIGRPQCAIAAGNSMGPWLQLKFTSVHVFLNMILFWRTDAEGPPICPVRCPQMNSGFQVWVGNSSLSQDNGNQTDILRNNNVCYEHNKNDYINSNYNVKCKTPLAGDTVIVTLPEATSSLTVCEIYIFECDDYWFGDNCNRVCSCFDENEICNKVTGACKSGCNAGKTGTDCYRTCGQLFWGPNCQNDCRCKENTPCHHVTGACNLGCPVGYIGHNCYEECSEGLFGDNCQENCHCFEEKACNKFTGQCPGNQCAAGWQGFNCQDSCQSGKFGLNCSFSCNCKKSLSCDVKDGSCSQGCPDGYVGLACQDICSSGNFGHECLSTCHCKNNMDCHVANGSCGLAGCKEGYTGSSCQKIKPPEPVPFPVIPVAAGLGGGFGLVLLTILIICLVRRCHRYQMDNEFPHDNIIVSKTNKTFLNDFGDESMAATSDTTDQHMYHSIVEEEDEVDEGVFVNPGETLSGETEINVSDIWAEVNRRINDNSLVTEYKALPFGLLEKHNVAEKPGYQDKCRFKGVIPYDTNRVILDLYRDVPFSDFINASYIDGYNKPKAYIAAQGPIETTRDDFWRMVWQVEASKIVMLANLVEKGKRKCDKYWPDSSLMLCGDIMIEHKTTTNYPTYTVRVFSVKKQGDKVARHITHYHYRNWPDKGVPRETTTLMVFREKVNEATDGPAGPIVVHCTSGIGRTGAFIAFDHQLNRADAEGIVDIYQCVHWLRHQRINMVPTSEKYLFLYSLITDGVLCAGSTSNVDEYLAMYSMMNENDESSKRTLQQQYKNLQSLKPKANQPYEAAKSLQNIDKNRSVELLASDAARVVLVSEVVGTTDYINAVFVPTFMNERSLIATQIPSEKTTVDFWRLVSEQKCRCVVMLSRSRDEESRSYWPPEGETTKLPPFKITTDNYLPSEKFDIRNMRVWYKPSGDTNGLALRNFTFGNWDTRTNFYEDILGLITAVQDWVKRSESGPVIVMCADGTEKCGLFCAILSLLERITTEDNVNIMVTVKQLREARRQFINEDQYRLLDDIVRVYLKQVAQKE